jgi:hypothetical protein
MICIFSNTVKRSFVWCGPLTLALSGVLVSVGAGNASAAPSTVEQVRELLSAHADAKLIPELDATTPAQLAGSPQGAALFDEAAKPPRDIPVTTYTQYRAFRATGDRGPYEGPYFDKRGRLAVHALAAWLKDDPNEINVVNDFIWNLCEETTWVLPAHEKSEPWNIDLFSAETACELAHILYVLGDRLPEEVRNRAHATVAARVLDPYLEHAHDYGWNSGRHNWTGVCAGSVGQTFLLMEPDLDRQARAVTLVIEQLERFKEKAFEPDGVSLEGIGYWCYGLLHYVGFGEMLRVRTGGAIDLLADPKMKAIAQYPAAAAIDTHAFAAFADSHEHQTLPAFLAARLAERTGVNALLTQASVGGGWRFSSRLYDLLWWHEAPTGEPVIEDAYLPGSGVAKFVGKVGEKRVVFAVKAGHNAEPHNHNDVGSFLLRIGELTYLCDPGAGLYSREYFGPKRYDNVFASSYGHSVPRIGGHLQQPGEQYRGTLEKTGDHTVHVDITSAYGLPELKHAARTFTLQPDGSLTLDAEYRFDGPGLEVEEAFMTWLDVDMDGPVARVHAPEGTVTLRADHGAFTAECLEQGCKENHVEDKVLTRIALISPVASETHTHIAITYEPQDKTGDR